MLDKILSCFSGGASVAIAVASFLGGAAVTHLYYANEIKEMKLEAETAVRAEQEKQKKGLADATNTINTAQDQYSGLVAERDALIERLRKVNEASLRKSASSADALARRAAACERVASELLASAKQCGEGWQRCAARKDALTNIVR